MPFKMVFAQLTGSFAVIPTFAAIAITLPVYNYFISCFYFVLHCRKVPQAFYNIFLKFCDGDNRS